MERRLAEVRVRGQEPAWVEGVSRDRHTAGPLPLRGLKRYFPESLGHLGEESQGPVLGESKIH